MVGFRGSFERSWSARGACAMSQTAPVCFCIQSSALCVRGKKKIVLEVVVLEKQGVSDDEIKPWRGLCEKNSAWYYDGSTKRYGNTQLCVVNSVRSTGDGGVIGEVSNNMVSRPTTII